MKYVVRRQRASGKPEWLRYGRKDQHQWMRSRPSAYEFTSFQHAAQDAKCWAQRGNNWVYFVDATEETQIRG